MLQTLFDCCDEVSTDSLAMSTKFRRMSIETLETDTAEEVPLLFSIYKVRLYRVSAALRCEERRSDRPRREAVSLHEHCAMRRLDLGNDHSFAILAGRKAGFVSRRAAKGRDG